MLSLVSLGFTRIHFTTQDSLGLRDSHASWSHTVSWGHDSPQPIVSIERVVSLVWFDLTSSDLVSCGLTGPHLITLGLMWFRLGQRSTSRVPSNGLSIMCSAPCQYRPAQHMFLCLFNAPPLHGSKMPPHVRATTGFQLQMLGVAQNGLASRKRNANSTSGIPHVARVWKWNSTCVFYLDKINKNIEVEFHFFVWSFHIVPWIPQLIVEFHICWWNSTFAS